MHMMPQRGIQAGFRGFFSGAISVLWGLFEIFTNKRMRALATIPVVLTGVIYVASVALLMVYGSDLMGLIWAKPSSAWLVVLWWIAVGVLVIGSFVIQALLFSTVVELVGGPFLDKIALEVLSKHDLPGKEAPFFKGTIPDLLRSLFFVVMVLGLALFAMIPVLGTFFMVLGTLVGWFGLASAAINPVLMLTQHKLSERFQIGWQYRYSMLGIGAVTAGMLFVPILGLYALPACTLGASELWALAKVAPQDALEA